MNSWSDGVFTRVDCFESTLSFRRSSHEEASVGFIEGNRSWNDCSRRFQCFHTRDLVHI